MHRICSNTDGSKPLFFYMKIINNVKQDVDSNTNVTKGKILAIKRKKTKGEKLITDHTFTKHRKLVQDTKKKIFSSPQYQETVFIPKV